VADDPMNGLAAREVVLARAAGRYLASEEFNGLPGRELLEEMGEGCLPVVEDMVCEGLLSLNFGNYHSNPHIKAFRARPVEEQIATLRERGLEAACIYPERRHLDQVVDQARYQDRPYTLALALGEPELSHRGFELAVLERYRNDPRFLYRNDDISGMFSMHTEFTRPGGAPERDQVSMQTFGFCFDDEQNCYVAAFLRYLSNLSPEHQQYWSTLEIDRRTRIHPDYFRPTILGAFPENTSVYTAVLLELKTINDMSRAMGRAPLFRQDFREGAPPAHFGRLVRPTAHEFAQFVHTLDRMLSDNLNLDFFGDDVSRETETERSDGRIEVRQKGSIQVLADWVERMFRPAGQEDRGSIAEMIRTLRDVRRRRMRPAHALDNDAFRQGFAQEQRDLIVKVYGAVKVLRLVVSRHPRSAAVELPPYIGEGNIWTL
jgi:hypothetical protein